MNITLATQLQTALRRLPKPQNDAELAVVTRWFFGVPLSLKVLIYHQNGRKAGTGFCTYEVAQAHHSYRHNGKWPCDYDIDHAFWNYIIGELQTGGVAVSSYGQTYVRGHRNQLRMQAWHNSRRKETGDTLRPAFVRLAAKLGFAERTG